MKGTLYLIPTPLGEHTGPSTCIHLPVIQELKHFVVEELRTARRFLKKIQYPHPFDEVIFGELNEHTSIAETLPLLEPLKAGHSVGLLSEAGVPCVADPGSRLVAMAHEASLKVVPLIGPSSLLLALMASGLNGQNFAFRGYAPVKPDARATFLRRMEQAIMKQGQTQILIETPYRNQNLLEAMFKHMRPELVLCLASDLTQPSEVIERKTLAEWKSKNPALAKKPTVFVLGYQ